MGYADSLTFWLIFPVIFGIVVFARARHVSDSIGEVVFGLFMCLWATCFLESWKREQAKLCVDWGMEEFEETQVSVPVG